MYLVWHELGQELVISLRRKRLELVTGGEGGSDDRRDSIDFGLGVDFVYPVG